MKIIDYDVPQNNQPIRPTAYSDEQYRKKHKAYEVWSNAMPSAQTPVETYVNSRNITAALPPSLKYVANLEHSNEYGDIPCMVAEVVDVNGKFIGIQGTFIKADGSGKADAKPARRKFTSCGGGVVRMAEASDTVIITEGIEDALTVQQVTGTPAWAALSTSGMKALELPANIKTVIICPDGDEAGEKAAQEAAWRWTAEGRKVKIARPPKPYKDFNEVLISKKAEAGTDAINLAIDQSVTHQNGPSLHSMSITELMQKDIPKRHMLLPWLEEGGLVMVYGHRGVGKTYFTHSLATSLACGTPFLRWPAEAPAGVLLVDGEMPLSAVRERLSTLMPDDNPAPLRVVSHETIYENADKDLNLGDPAWHAAVFSELDSHPEIQLIVIDNLACLMPKVRENKRDDWSNIVMPFLTKLRNRRVAVIIVHHTGKSGDQRGTSAHEDAMDTVIRLEALPNHDFTEGAKFNVRFTKSRHVVGDDVADFSVALETDGEGNTRWTHQLMEENNEARLMRHVREGIDNVSDAAEEMGVTKGTISKLKKKLIDKGELTEARNLVLADG